MPTKKPAPKKPVKRSLTPTTPQGYFDVVWDHFVTREKPLSVKLHGPKGARSPVGLFIPPAVYSATFEPHLIEVVVGMLSKSKKAAARTLGKKLSPHVELLDDLDTTPTMVVNTHKLTTVDSVPMLMSLFLSWVARKHGLKHPQVLPHVTPTKVTPNANSRNATAARKRSKILTRAF